MVWTVLREARLPMLAAVMAGFGGVISEIGASMMVGGNIKGQTRTLTTAMVLETSKGDFDVDRKSTRLNSSHGYISYAVFCLKKKKKKKYKSRQTALNT